MLKPNRRDVLRTGGAVVAAVAAGCAPKQPGSTKPNGVIIGEPIPDEVGRAVLADGGNVVDAVVAAALAAGVVSVPACGIAGYGGHMTLAFADTGKVTSIDFNSIAPAALRDDYFTVDENGQVPGKVNEHGWLAAGVPGTLAGLQLAIERYGTRTLAEALQPAIGYARDGFPVTGHIARSIVSAREQFDKDPGSQRLFFRDGKALREGDTFYNPDLAEMLETLAERGSADSFYRGDIAERIVEQFQKNGGVATVDDFAALQAREVEPVRLDWEGDVIYTGPLTAGGTTTIQILTTLRALDWTSIEDPLRRRHAQLEAMRIAWGDRLKLFGDPEQVDVPLDRLLSDSYADECAGRVRKAVDEKKPLEINSDWLEQNGTIHLSAADSDGNMAALTLTHGGNFGARVTVDGMGLVLGHGVSRFDPHPGRANSPGPHKRPLHNMVPTVVMRDGKPVLAVGARGGRRIPDAVLAVLTEFCGFKRSGPDSIEAARMHTEGGMRLQLDDRWSDPEREFFAGLGYETERASVAIASAASFDGGAESFVTAQR